MPALHLAMYLTVYEMELVTSLMLLGASTDAYQNTTAFFHA